MDGPNRWKEQEQVTLNKKVVFLLATRAWLLEKEATGGGGGEGGVTASSRGAAGEEEGGIDGFGGSPRAGESREGSLFVKISR
jgi:hypothetical protein